MKKIWPFSFYFLYYASFSSLLPFMVLFYQDLKFTGTQIGLLTGIPPLLTLFAAPFLTNLADAKRRHRLIMSFGIIVALTSIWIMQSMTMFLVIFILILVYNFFFSPVGSLADSATIAMLGDDKAMYGRIRLGGTIGWGVIAPLAGILVDHHGLKVAFWGFCFFMFINLFVAQNFVHDSAQHVKSENQGVRYFLTSRRWMLFLFAAFLGGLGTLSVSSYLFPYMAEMGSSESLMGIASMIPTLTELPIFFFGNRLVKRFGSRGLFLLALVLIGVRSLVFVWINSALALLVVQALGGTIFPAMWLAGVAYADEHAPTGLKSTAQGLFGAAVFGCGSAVGGFVGGLLLESVGGRGLFLVFGLAILTGIGLVELVRRLLPAEEVVQVAS